MKKRYLGWLALVAAIAACDSPLDTNPTQSIDSETALQNASAVQQALNGVYRGLQTDGLYTRQEVVYPDLYADNHDFTGTFQTDREYSLRAVSSSNGATSGTWAAAYGAINRANYVLAALPDIADMNDADKATARGEALFLRALNYSVLARWFGGVPIMTEPTKVIDDAATSPRASLADVYTLIEQDLTEASTLLGAGRRNGRATRGAADALLARVYLENGKYTQARDKATAVISNTTYRLVTNYRDLFTNKHTSESIFELHFAGGENGNSLAFWHFPSALGGRYGFRPSVSLNNAFEANDTRKAGSIGLSGTSRYGIKYHRISTEDDNVHILRLAEMYLIRAEANMRLNVDAATVRADIDVVRQRAGLLPLAATVDTSSELIDAILQERRVEFAMEGHRFFDLRRLGRATTVLQITQDRLLMPIPSSQIDVNPSLTQNPGY
jgi:hypothetical protein